MRVRFPLDVVSDAVVLAEEPAPAGAAGGSSPQASIAEVRAAVGAYFFQKSGLPDVQPEPGLMWWQAWPWEWVMRKEQWGQAFEVALTKASVSLALSPVSAQSMRWCAALRHRTQLARSQ